MLDLQGVREQLAPCLDAPVCWLGLSGGLDSMVLLEAVTQLRQTLPLPPLKAIHVHHGLHPKADSWTEHCVRECAARNIELHIERVKLPAGGSVEELARDARYQVFERFLGERDYLLLAHHRDDQLETLMFRMIRGTGLRGLAGMPRQRAIGAGQLLRPLLPWSREHLCEWACAQKLRWVEDPANANPQYARTALRHEVLPDLYRRWPAMPESLLRLAAHADEANNLLDERAAEDLILVQDKLTDPWLQVWPSLNLAALVKLSAARQRNMLRYWLLHSGLRLPDHRHLQTLVEQLTAARDSQPLIKMDGGQLRRSSDRLWLLPERGLPAGVEESLPRLADTALCAGNGLLRLQPGSERDTLTSSRWRIGYRQGGEQIKLAGRPRQSLKKLLQDAAIPVWMRPAIPLLYCDERLLSVAGRWTAEDAEQWLGGTGWVVDWEPHYTPVSD